MLVVSSFLPIFATISEIYYIPSASTVQTPVVSMASGTTGSSKIQSLDSDLTNISAALSYYVSANPPTTTAATCSTPSTDTSLVQPSASGNIIFNKGDSVCLWSSQYSASSVISAGTWTCDLWLSAKTSGSSLQVSIYLTNSTGAIVATILSNQITSTITTSESEILNQFSGSNGILPANGYIELVITAPSSGSRNYHFFWGTSQFSSFSTPSTYDYVIIVTNSSPTVSKQVILGSSSSMLSGTSRLLNLTIWMHSPVSNQISLGSSVVQNLAGSLISIAPSSSVYIAVYALASAQGRSSVNMSLLITSPNGVYSQYTFDLSVY